MKLFLVGDLCRLRIRPSFETPAPPVAQSRAHGVPDLEIAQRRRQQKQKTPYHHILTYTTIGRLSVVPPVL